MGLSSGWVGEEAGWGRSLTVPQHCVQVSPTLRLQQPQESQPSPKSLHQPQRVQKKKNVDDVLITIQTWDSLRVKDFVLVGK